jgi:DNA-binding NarL/FixJ family response regulator
MKKLRLVIADDHHILLDGLKALLHKQKDMEVVGFFDNGQLLFDALAGLGAIDVAIADINMPGLNGLELTMKMKEAYPAIPIIILSMHDDTGHIMEMVDAGVQGYLLKNVNDTVLLQAIRTVAGGRMAFSPEVSDKIALFIKNEHEQKVQPEQPRLTDREIEILKLIAREYSNARIGETLFISERTVETHRKNMMRKTNNKTIVGLLKYAMDQKLV